MTSTGFLDSVSELQAVKPTAPVQSNSIIPNRAISKLNNLTVSLRKLLDLHLQSYILIFITIIAVMIAILNKNVDKKVPMLIVINSAISVYVIECLIMGGCEIITWFFIVFNSLMMLGLAGVFKTGMAFKVNSLILDSPDTSDKDKKQ